MYDGEAGEAKKETKGKLLEEIKTFVNRMKEYEFYKEFNMFYIRFTENSAEIPTNFLQTNYDNFIKYIENNNAATLVGTLQDCYKFASLNPDYIPSSKHLMDLQREENTPYSELEGWIEWKTETDDIISRMGRKEESKEGK